MAYFYKNGTGIDSNAYIYVQLQVTRTDYPTYSRFSVKSVAVSDTGTSSFIRGQVTTNQAGNSWTAATGWKSVSYNGTTTLATATFDVARGASDKTAHIGAYAEGGGTGIYAGGTDYAWLDVTVPKVLAPNAPTGCTATYVSDSQASISWTNGTADTDHPRDATLVERRDGSNEWAQVASVSGTASSYTDNGISPNGQYQYRVRAKNAAGYSAYSTSGSIYTTPASPASVTLDKTAATTVQVDATGAWVYAVTYDVELTYDSGATWSTVATSTTLPYSATVSGGTVQFRVRATRGALASDWTLSASLVTITPPLAPTIVQAPANPSAYGEQAEVAWTPNHPDGSSQESAEIKVTDPGGTSTTYTVTTATSYQLTPNATGTWTAQVRTKGLDPSYGEWSQSVSWAVANPPAVVITSPATDGTDVVSLPMTVSWSVTDPTGVSAQRIIIEGDGQILNRTLAGDVRTVSLNASDVALENGQTYTIRLRVMGGSGLVTEQTRIFDVAWLAPAAPVLQLTEGEGRSATIDVMDTHYSEIGATIAVDGSAIADEFTVFGASVQSGTPTPSAPVPIESVGGRNLVITNKVATAASTAIADYEDFTTKVVNGVTFINNGDGTIRANGTASANAIIYLPLKETVASGTTIYVSGCPPFGSAPSNTYSLIAYATNNTDQAYEFGNGQKKVLTAAINRVRIYVYNGANVDVTFRPCVSTTMVSETTGSVDIKTAGKNLLWQRYREQSRTSIVVNNVTWTFNANGSIKANGTASANSAPTFSYFGFLKAGTYRVSGCSTSTSSTYQFRINIYTDISGTLKLQLNDYGGSGTLDADGIYYINAYVCVLNGKQADNVVFHPQLERSSTATEYVQYEGSTYPIDLQGNALRSLSDGTRDELRVGERKVLVKRVGHIADVSARTLSYSGGSIPYVYFPLTAGEKGAPTSGSPARNNCMSTVAPPKVPLADPCCYVTNDGLTVVIGSTAFTSLATATTMLTGAEFDYVLATPQEIDLGAASDHPFIPEGGEMWVDGTEMEAVLRPADYAGQPTIQSVDVQRVNADGTVWTVATGLTVGGSCIDPLPPLGVPVTYRATSSAASGSTASGEFTETFGGREWVLNFGNAAQEHIGFVYNPQADLSLKQGGTPYHFADGGAGRGLPVFYPTTDRDYAGSLRFDTILYGDSDKVLDLCDRYPVAWLRDPFGHRWRAHVAPSVSHGVGQIWPVTLSWDAMRFEEAWDG